MDIVVQIPDKVARSLGGTVDSRRVLEGLALEGYLANRLTQAQVGELLNMDRWEVEEFLDRHNARTPYSSEMLEEDRATLARHPRG